MDKEQPLLVQDPATGEVPTEITGALQEAERVRMPEGMARDELALRVLIAAATGRVPTLH
jgi:hypothetical protein